MSATGNMKAPMTPQEQGQTITMLNRMLGGGMPEKDAVALLVRVLGRVAPCVKDEGLRVDLMQSVISTFGSGLKNTDKRAQVVSSTVGCLGVKSGPKTTRLVLEILDTAVASDDQGKPSALTCAFDCARSIIRDASGDQQPVPIPVDPLTTPPKPVGDQPTPTPAKPKKRPVDAAVAATATSVTIASDDDATVSYADRQVTHPSKLHRRIVPDRVDDQEADTAQTPSKKRPNSTAHYDTTVNRPPHVFQTQPADQSVFAETLNRTTPAAPTVQRTVNLMAGFLGH
jgi:hypothetical protein